MFALMWSQKFSRLVYPDPFDLFADTTAILRDEVTELASLGCTYIQIDAPELATLVDPETRARSFESQGIAPDRLLSEGVEMLNAVAHVPGITYGLHLCRGNAGRWMSSGGYDYISRRVFKGAQKYQVFLLEYDDMPLSSERAMVRSNSCWIAEA